MTTAATGAAPAPVTAGFYRLPVTDVTVLTDDAVSIELGVPAELADAFAYLPGQHLPVRVPPHLLAPAAGEERRTYSLCVAPSTARRQGRLRIGVRRVETGVLSTHLVATLRPGDELEVGTPTGRFVLEPAPPSAEQTPRHVVGIVGGSGVTPVLAIAGELLATDPGARLSLVVVNRTAEAVMFAEELADLKDAHPARVSLTHVLTREHQNSPLLSGRPDHERWARLLEGVLAGAPPVTGWYLCGPRDLVTTARSAALDHGADPAQVHVELFHVGDPPPVPRARPGAADAVITAWLGGRATTVTATPGDGSVLDAVLRARADAPYACRGGVCGTCRAKVVDGEVAMSEQWALEPAEVAAGYVLTCRSRAASDTLGLDFDA